MNIPFQLKQLIFSLIISFNNQLLTEESELLESVRTVITYDFF
jgi:hypothetical protein